MITLALLLAFIGFCGIMARTAFAQSKKTLENYQNSIRAQFDEAEHLLQEAKSLLEKAEQEQLSISDQVDQIMALAHSEVQFIMEKAHKEIVSQKESYTHTFECQTRTLQSQWKETVMDILWQHIREYARKVTASSSGHDVFLFIEKRIIPLSSPKKTTPH